MSKYTLGTDEGSNIKGIAYIGYMLGMFILWWMMINTTEAMYTTIFMMGIIMFFVAEVIDILTKGRMSISTVSEENPKTRPFGFDKITNLQLFYLTVIISIGIIFSSLSSKMSIIGVPTFSTATMQSQSLLSSSFLVGFVSLPETLAFFCVIFATVFAITNYIIKEPLISFLIASGIASTIFMSYHFSVYGIQNLAGSISCFMFGWLNCLWVFLFRSTYSLIIFHFLLNFLAIFFSMSIIGGLI